MWWFGVAVAVILTVFFIAAMIVGKRADEREDYRQCRSLDRADERKRPF